MKKTRLILILVAISLHSTAQFVAKMEIKTPIIGLCNNNDVYALFPSFNGQEESVCPISKDSILSRLNGEVSFLKDSSGFNDKGMIGLVINCKGEVVQCKISNKTKNSDLDMQIELVFNSLGKWKAGKLNGKTVDTSRLFSFRIIDGKFTFN